LTPWPAEVFLQVYPQSWIAQQVKVPEGSKLSWCLDGGCHGFSLGEVFFSFSELWLCLAVLIFLFGGEKLDFTD
jgi:hypothetical protein